MFGDKHPYKDMRSSEYAREINEQEFTQNIHHFKGDKEQERMIDHDESFPDEEADSMIEQSDYLPNLRRPPKIDNNYNLINENRQNDYEEEHEHEEKNHNYLNKHNAYNDGGRNEKIRAGHSFNYQTSSDKQLIFKDENGDNFAKKQPEIQLKTINYFHPDKFIKIMDEDPRRSNDRDSPRFKGENQINKSFNNRENL